MPIPEGEAYVHALEAAIAALRVSMENGHPVKREHARIVALACARNAKRTAEKELVDATSAFVPTTENPAAEPLTELRAKPTFPRVYDWVQTKPQMRTMLANALKNAFMEQTIIDIAVSSTAEIKDLPNVGTRGRRELMNFLAEHGLHVGMSREGAEAAYVEART